MIFFYKNKEENIALVGTPDWVPVALAHHKPKRSNVFADYLKAVKFVAPQLSLALTTHFIHLWKVLSIDLNIVKFYNHYRIQ